MPSCIVVVPCYNEERRLRMEAFRAVVEQNGEVAWLFVNDGSSDGTGSMLEASCRHSSGRMMSLHLPRNCGKAEAVRLGLVEAIRRGAASVGYWDADGATPFSVVVQFRDILRRQAECQLVMGTRLSLLGRDIERGRLRRVLGHCFSVAASCVLGVRIRDTQCGAKLFRVTPVLWEALQRPFLSRWIFDVELLLRLLRQSELVCQPTFRRAIYENVLEEWREVGGSNVRPKDFFRAAWELAVIWWTYRARRQAMQPEATRPSEHWGPPQTFPVPASALPRSREDRAA